MEKLKDALEVLSDRLVVADPGVLVAETEFGLPGVPHRVQLKVFYRPQRPKDKAYDFRLSHHIKTPLKSGPHRPDVMHAKTADEAMKSGLLSVLEPYRKAIDAGHRTTDEWLVEVL